MKNLFLTLAAALFASCGDETTTPILSPVDDNPGFIGTFTVAPGTDDAFTLTDAEVNFTLREDGVTVDMNMLKVKFAELMPQLDITVPGVTVKSLATGAGAISGDDIIPLAMGGKVERYIITDLTGGIDETGRTLTMSMKCGHYPLSFSGQRIE